MLTYLYGIKVLAFFNVCILYHLCIRPSNCTATFISIANVTDQSSTWNMVRELGMSHGAKFWSFHYQGKLDASWKRFYRKLVKNYTNIGYFGVMEIGMMNYSKYIGSSQEMTLNLYVNKDLTKWNRIIAKQPANRKGSHHNRKYKYNTASNIWVFQIPNNSMHNSVLKMLDNATIAYDTLAFGYTHHKSGIIEIYDIYRVNIDFKITIKRCGTWSPLSGLQMVDPNTWSRRASLEGMHIRVVSAKWAPDVHTLKTIALAKVVSWEGLLTFGMIYPRK